MSTQFTLQGPVILPEDGKPQKLVVLLHGYGASGENLLTVASEWQHVLPNAAFFCPNAPFRCREASEGYEWFAFSERIKTIPPAHAPEDILRRIRQACPLLNTFLDELLKHYDLRDQDMAVMGFSQGAMIALYTTTRRATACGAVLAYSGAFMEDPDIPLQSYPEIFLVHGEVDEVVPIAYFYHAKTKLDELKFTVTPYIEPNTAHSISQKGLIKGGEFLKTKLR